MLSCVIAARLPTIIDSAETVASTLFQSSWKSCRPT